MPRRFPIRRSGFPRKTPLLRAACRRCCSVRFLSSASRSAPAASCRSRSHSRRRSRAFLTRWAMTARATCHLPPQPQRARGGLLHRRIPARRLPDGGFGGGAGQKEPSGAQNRRIRVWRGRRPACCSTSACRPDRARRGAFLPAVFQGRRERGGLCSPASARRAPPWS